MSSASPQIKGRMLRGWARGGINHADFNHLSTTLRLLVGGLAGAAPVGHSRQSADVPSRAHAVDKHRKARMELSKAL